MSAASLLQSLTEFAKDADHEYNDVVIDEPETANNVEALAILLIAVRDARADLQLLYKRIEEDVMSIAGEKRFLVEGVGEVEIKSKTARTQWDTPALVRKLVALALDERVLDESTGEYEPAHEAVARVLSEAARMEWRTTPLRARHIPIDEYCHEERGGYSVRLPPRGDR